MFSLEKKWNYKVEMTLGELYNPSWELPHKGVLEISRELETIIGKEKTFELLTKVAEKFMIEQAMEATNDNPIDSFSDFLELFNKTSEESFWDKINVDEYVKITENMREVKTVECVAADVWRSWGAEDIGYAYNCAADFAFIKALHPNMRLERTKTLMLGDDCCDFRFIWEEKTSKDIDMDMNYNVSAANLRTCRECGNLYAMTLIECPKCGKHSEG
jgi:hypothetical protein